MVGRWISKARQRFATDGLKSEFDFTGAPITRETKMHLLRQLCLRRQVHADRRVNRELINEELAK